MATNEVDRPELSWSAPFTTVERYGTTYELTADRFLAHSGDGVAVTLAAPDGSPTLSLRISSIALRRTATPIQAAATLATAADGPGNHPVQVLNDAGMGGQRLSMSTDRPLVFGQYEIDVALQDSFTSEIVNVTLPASVGLARVLPAHVVENGDSHYRVSLTASGRDGESVTARVSTVGERSNDPSDPDPAHHRIDPYAVTGYLSVSSADGVDEELISSRGLAQKASDSSAEGWALVTRMQLEPGQHAANFELRDTTTNALLDRISTTIDVPALEITNTAAGPSSLSL